MACLISMIQILIFTVYELVAMLTSEVVCEKCALIRAPCVTYVCIYRGRGWGGVLTLFQTVQLSWNGGEGAGQNFVAVLYGISFDRLSAVFINNSTAR